MTNNIDKIAAAAWKRSARRKRRYLVVLRERLIRQEDWATVTMIERFLGHIPSQEALERITNPKAIVSDRGIQ